MTKSNPLAESFLDFFKSALPQVQQWQADEGVPYDTNKVIEFLAEGKGYKKVEKTSPNYIQFAWRFQKSNGNSHSLRQCALLHAREGVLPVPTFTDAIGNEISHPTDEQVADALSTTIITPLIHAMNVHGLERLDDALVMEAYELYHNMWRGDVPSREAIMPLTHCNICLEELPFELQDGLTVIPFDETHKNSFEIPADMDLGTHLLYGISNSNTAISWTFHGNREFDESRCRAIKLITAMRLAYDASIGAEIILERPLHTSQRLVGVQSFSEVKSTVSPGQPLHLNCNIVAFRNLYARLQQPFPQLDLAINRFNQSFNPRTPEDALIDLIVVLEKCLPSITGGEIRFQVALNGAILLAKVRNPRETFELLSIIYNCRNKFVHSGQELVSISKQENDKYARLTGLSATPAAIVGTARMFSAKVLTSHILQGSIEFSPVEMAKQRLYELLDSTAAQDASD